jgi:peptidoglycan/xylan/chitin deacetylase (PgdA/CDA1 family)
MNILHVLSQTELTGAEVYAQQLCEAQQKAGHQVYAVSDQWHIPFSCPTQNLKIAQPSFLEKLRTLQTVRSLLRQKQIQVIHCHSRAAVRIAHWARWGLKTAVVTTLHGRQHFSFSKKLFDIYGEYLIAICENVQKSHSLQFGTPVAKIQVIPNPFHFTNNFQKKTSSRLRISWIGRASGPKGDRLLEFLKALQPYKSAFKDIDLDVVLTGNPSEAFKKQIYEIGPNSLHLKGPVDLKNYFSTCDVVIGSGRVAIEAAALGLAVFVVGEYGCHGWLRHKNLQACSESNFGDIGWDGSKSEISWLLFAQEFIDGLAAPPKDPQVIPWIQAHYSFEKVLPAIMHLYKKAAFKRATKKHIPILMYHMIPDAPLTTQHKIFVPKKIFAQQLKTLSFLNFTALTFRDLHDFFEMKKCFSQFPKKPVLLTFDDGYADNLTNALPLLTKYNFRATIFLLSKMESHNGWDQQDGATFAIMDAQQRKQLAAANIFEIGSHGHHHLKLTELPEEKVLADMILSKQLLEKEFNTTVCAVAYPFGVTNKTVQNLAKQAGYFFGVNTSTGDLLMSDDFFNIFRVNVFPQDGAFSIWKKTSSWYRKRFFKKHQC